MTIRTHPKASVAVLALLMAGAVARPAAAQSMGNFRWHIEPFCNVVSVSVTQTTVNPTRASAVYLLDGFDDQCGSARASVVGSAFFNADGSIGIGLTTVLAPGGQPVHIEARIDLHTLSGTWADSAGHSGAFVYLPGGTPSRSGTLRPPPPPPPSGLVPGAVGAVHINPTEVQRRVSGTCPIGQYLRGIGADGSVQCEMLPSTSSVGGSCPDGQVLSGLAADGTVMCKRLLAVNISTTADDPAAAVASYSSIAVSADGLPVIAHQIGAAALRVTKCGNAACTFSSSTTVDDPADLVGFNASIAVGSDGLPVISHWNQTTTALRVTKCGNAECSAGNVSTDVDNPANDVGAMSSIAIGTDGLPIISYLDSTAAALRVTKCGNAACTAGNVSTTVDDPANNVGLFTAIAIGADGFPVISHQDSTLGALRVTRCGNAACTSGNVSTTVDAPGHGVGRFTSIAVGPDSLPVISHKDSSSGGTLRVTKCGDGACTTNNVSTIVDDPATDVGDYTSIAIAANSLPLISHHDVTTGALRVTSCGNAACTAGSATTIVDKPAAVVGAYSSLEIGTDGLPVISYFSTNSSSLRVTKCATTTCQ